MNRRLFFLGACVLGLVGAGFAAMLFRGNFGHVMAVLVGTLFLGPPLVLVALIGWLVGRPRGERGPRAAALWTATVTGGLAAAAVLQVPGLVFGVKLNQRDLEVAQRWCEGLVPELEAYRSLEGSYPESLEELGRNLEGAPRRIDEHFAYQGDDESFSFYIVDPADLMGARSYESEDAVWRDVD